MNREDLIKKVTSHLNKEADVTKRVWSKMLGKHKAGFAIIESGDILVVKIMYIGNDHTAKLIKKLKKDAPDNEVEAAIRLAEKEAYRLSLAQDR